MHTTRLRRVGGSVMVSVPPAILDLLHLEAGSPVGIAVEKDKLIIAAHPRPRYTLDELLAQCDPEAPLSKADKEWINLPSVGREL